MLYTIDSKHDEKETNSCGDPVDMCAYIFNPIVPLAQLTLYTCNMSIIN